MGELKGGEWVQGPRENWEFTTLGTKLSNGDKVTYFSPGGGVEKGIIKCTDCTEPEMFVVYNCAERWDNYHAYTGVLTRKQYIKLGWPEGKHTIIHKLHMDDWYNRNEAYVQRTFEEKDGDYEMHIQRMWHKYLTKD